LLKQRRKTEKEGWEKNWLFFCSSLFVSVRRLSFTVFDLKRYDCPQIGKNVDFL